MKRGRGKQKGNAFESQTAKTLSRWLTGGEDSKQLIPTRSSGGWRPDGGTNWRHVGDLAPNGERGDEFRRVFALELKHHREILFWHLWTQSPGENIVGWWNKLLAEIQGCSDYPDFDPLPLLIFKMNHRPTMIATVAPLVEDEQSAVLIPSMGMGIIPLDVFLGWEPIATEVAAEELCKRSHLLDLPSPRTSSLDSSKK